MGREHTAVLQLSSDIYGLIEAFLCPCPCAVSFLSTKEQNGISFIHGTSSSKGNSHGVVHITLSLLTSTSAQSCYEADGNDAASLSTTLSPRLNLKFAPLLEIGRIRRSNSITREFGSSFQDIGRFSCLKYVIADLQLLLTFLIFLILTTSLPRGWRTYYSAHINNVLPGPTV